MLTLCLAALLAPPAFATALQDLRGLAPAGAAPPAVGAAREVPGAPPGPGEPPVAELLDPRYWALGEAEALESQAEWKRRLRARGGKAGFALVSPLDPRRELLLLVPGVGMKFQDAHALVRLDDAYQVAIAVVDETLAIPEAARRVADALERLPASGPLRVIGHSFGATIGHFLMQELADRGRLGQGKRFPRALFVGIDGPWRGVDLPWLARLPGLRGLSAAALKRLPIKKPPTEGSYSVINRGPGMRAFHALRLPPEVTVHFVTVLGPQGTSPRLRHFEPVASWYSQELGAGELKRLWKVLREDRGGDWNAYDSWAFGGLIRKQGLQNLERTLQRDADWGEHGWELRRAALEARTLEEFARGYDAVVSEIVDTFHGRHTPFMWEDPEFLPYIRKRLGDW